MLVLTYDPAQSCRPNTFWVRLVGSLFRITATVRTTEAAHPIGVRFWAQLQRRDSHRRQDDEGHPVLYVSRHGGGEMCLALEPSRLHPDLPFAPMQLNGWEPPTDE